MTETAHDRFLDDLTHTVADALKAYGLIVFDGDLYTINDTLTTLVENLQ